MKKKLLEGKKILIVDDEPDVLDTLGSSLAMCEISKAFSFRQAKELLETQYFDFAILDIMGVNGYRLLEIANEKKVIAVMLTAHARSPEDVVRSRKEGAASYVPKAKMNDIEEVLNDIIEDRKEGKGSWWRWYDRFGSYFEDKYLFDWTGEEEFRKENQVIKWEKYFYQKIN